MEEYTYSLLGTVVRVSFRGFPERPGVFVSEKVFPGAPEGFRVDIRKSRREDMENMAGSAGSRGTMFDMDGKALYLDFDPGGRKVSCYFEDGLPVDPVVLKAVNNGFLDMQPALDMFHLHSASIVIGGKAYLFPAPSGGGKSTLSFFAREAGLHVINEETCCLKKSGGRFIAGNYPCLAPPEVKRDEWEVGGLFLLNRWDRDEIRNIGVLEAIKRTLPEATNIFRDDNPCFTRKQHNENVFRVLSGLLDRVPFGTLDFRKSREVIGCLTAYLGI